MSVIIRKNDKICEITTSAFRGSIHDTPSSYKQILHEFHQALHGFLLFSSAQLNVHHTKHVDEHGLQFDPFVRLVLAIAHTFECCEPVLARVLLVVDVRPISVALEVGARRGDDQR